MAILQTLKTSKLLNSWSEHDLNVLARSSKLRDLSPGETLFLESDEATSFFILSTGTIHIQKSASNMTQEVALIGAGSHFGELGLLSAPGEKELRSASASAGEACQLVEIPYGAMHDVLDANPALGLQFYKNLATSLAARIRGTTEDLVGIKARHLRHT